MFRQLQIPIGLRSSGTKDMITVGSTRPLQASGLMGNADASAIKLTTLLRARVPFIYVRYGDGALECIRGKIGRTCDGEIYSNGLANELIRCWNLLFSRNNVYIGHWFSAKFDSVSPRGMYREDYENLIHIASEMYSHRPNWIHFEALLLMRISQSLKEFYITVRNDKRRKLLMGPKEWAPAAKVLDTDFYEIPVSSTLFSSHLDDIRLELDTRQFDVLLYGAGMAGNIPVIDHWNALPEKTYINLGSALDPIYRGRTRRQQITAEQAQAFFRSVESPELNYRPL